MSATERTPEGAGSFALAMLAAHKALLVADVKQRATALRRLELDVILRRYTSLIAVVSISAGFAFDALSVIQVDPELYACFDGFTAPPPPPSSPGDSGEITPSPCDDKGFRGRVVAFFSMYFVTTCLALASGMFVVTVGTFVVAWAQRLALSGENSGRSLEVAVSELFGFFPTALIGAAISIVSILLSGFAIIWVRESRTSEEFVWIATAFMLIIGILVTTAHSVYVVYKLRFAGDFVHGDIKLTTGTAGIAEDERSFTSAVPAIARVPIHNTANITLADERHSQSNVAY